ADVEQRAELAHVEARVQAGDRDAADRVRPRFDGGEHAKTTLAPEGAGRSGGESLAPLGRRRPARATPAPAMAPETSRHAGVAPSRATRGPEPVLVATPSPRLAFPSRARRG